MFARAATLRFAVAVLALFGQLTPVVALPAGAALRPKAGSSLLGCAPLSCDCAPIKKALMGCCCSKPEQSPPKSAEPKSCCKAPPAAKPPTSSCESEDRQHPQTVATLPHGATGAKLAPGGKCRCDKTSNTVTAEPAVPAVVVPVVVRDHASRPERPRWFPLTAINPLPPPSPPPRIDRPSADPLATAP